MIARSADEVARKLDVLRAHCEDVGRDPGEIARSVLYVGDALFKDDRERFVEEMLPFAALGVDTVVVMPSSAAGRVRRAPRDRRRAGAGGAMSGDPTPRDRGERGPGPA